MEDTEKNGVIAEDSQMPLIEKADDVDEKKDFTAASATPIEMTNREKGERVCLSISGTPFVTTTTTLRNIPDSRLALLTHDDDAYDADNDVYFFERNPVTFAFILAAYQSGTLHTPQHLNARLVREEMDFWKIPYDLLSSESWQRYRESEKEEAMMIKIEKLVNEEASRRANIRKLASNCKTMHAIHLFLDEPMTSIPAKIWSYVYVCLLMLSLILVLCATSSHCRVENDRVKPTPEMIQMMMAQAAANNQTFVPPPQPPAKAMLYLFTNEHPAMQAVNLILLLFFLLVLIVRAVVFPNKLAFIRSIPNLIDLVSVPCLFVMYILMIEDSDLWLKNGALQAYFLILVIYLLRTIRIHASLLHLRPVRVVCYTFRASLLEVVPHLALMSSAILLFAGIAYIAEFRQDEHFTTIPESLYWAVITVSTVGYGNVLPATNAGKVLACVAAVTGMIFMVLPVPIFVRNYNHFHKEAVMYEDLLARCPVPLKVEIIVTPAEVDDEKKSLNAEA